MCRRSGPDHDPGDPDRLQRLIAGHHHALVGTGHHRRHDVRAESRAGGRLADVSRNARSRRRLTDDAEPRGPLRAVQSLRLDGAVYASPMVMRGRRSWPPRTTRCTRSTRPTSRSGSAAWAPRRRQRSGSAATSTRSASPAPRSTTRPRTACTSWPSTAARCGTNCTRSTSTTGAVAWSKSVDLPGVSARDMQQRGALAITGGKVWVSYGAQAGDCGDYKGRVVGVPLDGSGSPMFYSPPTKRGGGIWNPAGPTVNAAGHLLAVSANGAAFPGDAYDHTNTVLELDGAAKLVDSFAPTDWAANNQGDVGLGSQGVALVGSTWAVLGGQVRPGLRAAAGSSRRHRRPGRRAGHLQVLRWRGGRRQRGLPAVHRRRTRGAGRRCRQAARAVARRRTRSPVRR